MTTPKWRVYLRLGRVSNLPTVWSNTLAGIVLSQREDAASLDVLSAVLLATAMSLYYVGGMFLNDAFDRAIDAKQRPERPIPSGAIGAVEVFAIGFGLLGAGLLLATVQSFTLGRGGFSAFLSGAVLASAIVLYDVWHKDNPLSPLLMGVCRVLVYFTAALCVTGALGSAVWTGAVVLLSYLIGLTYVAKQENLTEVRNLWPLFFLFFPLAITTPRALTNAASAVLFVILFVWIATAVSRLRRKGRGIIPRVVVSLIAGISILDGLLIAAHGSPGIGIAAALGFAATLFFQRYVSGT